MVVRQRQAIQQPFNNFMTVVVVGNTSFKCNIMAISANDLSDWNPNFAWVHALAIVFTIFTVPLGIICSFIALLVDATVPV